MKEQKSLLIAVKNKKNILSKEQQTFNRLVKKIEKLQAELSATKNDLDKKIKYHNEHIIPLGKEILALRKTLIRVLLSLYENDKTLSKKERVSLLEFLKTEIDYVLQEEEADDEFKIIFEKVYKTSYEKAVENARKENFADVKEQVESMYRSAGFDINLDDLHEKMTDEEMAEKMFEMEAEFKKQFAGKENPGRKKTKKQLEKEAKEKEIREAKSKNIGSIYKQLAKIFHPDLEPDPDKKIEKEELMKQLTAAYENHDLHTLLRLELQWIHKEEDHIEQMTDEKLRIYNDIMKEQAGDLQMEINETFFHPQYQALHGFVMFPPAVKTLRFEPIVRDLKDEKKRMEYTINELQSGDAQARKELKRMLKGFDEDDEFTMNDFFDMNEIIEEMFAASQRKAKPKAKKKNAQKPIRTWQKTN